MFKSPKDTLGDLSAKSAATLIAAASDVALMVDSDGIIRDVAFNKEELSLELDGHGRWLGSKFVEIVTSDTRTKIVELLQTAVSKSPSNWRQVNHPVPGGEDIPIQYSAINVGSGREAKVVIVGRDLRPLATMQQRLIAAQQSMERDYAKLRHAETRYRLLFQVSSEAVMIVDASSRLISDANPAALALLDESGPKVVRSKLENHFTTETVAHLQNLLADVRSSGRDNSASLRTEKSQRECTVAVSLFRQENASLFLVRLLPKSSMAETGALKSTSMLIQLFEASPDALVIAQHDGRIIKTNAAFLELAQLGNEEQARGELLDRWVGRTGVDLGVAIATLHQSNSIKLFATVLRGERGATTEIELSAVSLTLHDDKSNLGFAIRNVDNRLSPAPQRELPRSMAQLTEMIGRVPLKDLVRETTDVIEKLSIEAALELTGNNRASAAEMLGLSRQSLYVKLRRFGLAEHAVDGEGDDE